MVYYPYLTPQILTDEMFVSHGGYTGSATAIETQVAYAIAEHQVAAYFNSFIIPTTVTGTFTFYDPGKINLAYGGYLHTISDVTINCRYTNSCPTCIDYTLDGSARILRPIYGDIEVYDDSGYMAGWGNQVSVTLVYNSGLPSDITNLPIVQNVLTRVAQIELNEMVDPGANEGGAGDPGLRGWQAISYSEQRIQLGHTSFGTSAMANRLLMLLKNIPGSTPVLRAR